MSWDAIDKITVFSTIWANIVTIITWVIALLWFFLAFKYFTWKKFKAIIIWSNTFQVPLEKEDIVSSIFPSKIFDETINIIYDKNLISPKDFCNENKDILSELKSKYNPICIFWISEIFIPFWIWYYIQDSTYIRWFRKLKENIIDFSWNPWAWTSILSLKWILFFKWLLKAIKNNYNNPTFNFNQWEEINLIIKISYDINLDSIPDDLKDNKNLIFWLNKTDSSFLINESQVFTFSNKIKMLMYKLDEQLWSNWKINIFWTLPIPFCLKLWQNIHRNWPEVVLYDFNRNLNKYEIQISTKNIIL